MNNATSIDSGGFLGIPAAALPDQVKNIYILNFNLVASFTLFFYVTLLNLDKELTYIWSFKFSYSTVLFGVIRLLVTMAEIASLLFNVVVWRTTDSVCNFDYWLTTVLWLLIGTCVDILLIFRVYALYGKKQVLLWSLCVMEGVAFLAVASLVGIVTPQTQSIANPFPHQLPIVICVVLDAPNATSYVCLPVLLVQTTLFALALGRHIYLQKDGLKLSNATSHIYHTFIRDGVWVFFVLLVCILLYVIGFKLNPILSEIAFVWTYSITGLSASYLIINLRLAIHKVEELRQSSLACTEIRFNTAAFDQNVGVEASQGND